MAAKVVTGNRLNDGVVIYLNESGDWSERIAEALVAESDEAAADILRLAERPAEAVRVIAPYLIDVILENGRPRAESQREAIRAAGPTVRRDLGKQADDTAATTRQ